MPKFIATEPIMVGSVLGYAVGDDVPEENVKAHGWEESVEEVGSKDDDKP